MIGRSERISAFGATLLLGAGVALFGCGEPEPDRPLPRFEDLVADYPDALVSGAGEVRIESFFCRDQRRFGLVLEAGEEIEVSLDLELAPRLRLEGCMRRQGATSDPGASSIALRFESADGAVLREARADVGPGWWTADVELPELVGSSGVTVRLTADVAPGWGLFLEDAFVEHLRMAPSAPASNQVLLISVDTLREDAIGALGGHYPTPHLDRLAARSEVFLPHYAASNWTKPSHASLLTGELTAVHGVDRYEAVLPEEIPLLAERLAEREIETGALVFDCKHLEPRFGFARGFDGYRVEPWSPTIASRWVADWIVERRDRPFFFFFHLFDPHSDFDRLPYEGPGVDRRVVAQRFGLSEYGCDGDVCSSVRLMMINSGEVEPIENEAELLGFLYGKGVEETDRALGLLFDALERAGVLDGLTVILTSDHGEAFFEHGMVLHEGLWEEVLRVPLVVKWPGDRNAGTRRSEPTSALDVAPTVLASFGLDHDELPGRDLAELEGERPVFSGIARWMVREGRYKLIEHEDGLALYDLEEDPGERVDLAEELPEVHRQLSRTLVERRNADLERGGLMDREDSPLSEEEIELLEALGYLGESAD